MKEATGMSYCWIRRALSFENTSARSWLSRALPVSRRCSLHGVFGALSDVMNEAQEGLFFSLSVALAVAPFSPKACSESRGCSLCVEWLLKCAHLAHLLVAFTFISRSPGVSWCAFLVRKFLYDIDVLVLYVYHQHVHIQRIRDCIVCYNISTCIFSFLFWRFTRWHITPRGAAFYRVYGQPHERLCSLPCMKL